MRIGIIGAGGIGALRARSIKDNANTELAGVMDVSIETAKKVSDGVPAFDNLEDLPNTFHVIRYYKENVFPKWEYALEILGSKELTTDDFSKADSIIKVIGVERIQFTDENT